MRLLFRNSGWSHYPPAVAVGPVWRRHPLAAALGGGVVLAAIVTHLGPHVPSDFERYHARAFDVVEVRAGDTVVVAAPDGASPHTVVRMMGVRASGDAATAFTRNALAGKRVRLLLCREQTRAADQRLLAYVVIDASGVRFNEVMLQAGLARADTQAAHPCAAEYSRLERDARRNRLGLWRDGDVASTNAAAPVQK
ncbi:MAG TPA: thermonuclease family protein [Phycisphaerae bacterium]|nr:thermonuclease family protein [Phycisphaerae bacterium]